MIRNFATILGILSLAVFQAVAQVDTAVITGRVYDNAGAVIPSAQVVVLNTGTNYKLELLTNADGLYISAPLPAGNYRVSVSHPGFRQSAKLLQLNISERPAVDLVLEVGAVTETVNVQELAPLLQTEVTTLGTLRSEREVKSLPINGRNFAELVRFSAGVVPAQAMKLNLALSQQRGNVSNSVNGGSLGDNNFLVDGLQNNNNHQGWGLINYPELDAIEQYRVETSVPDARFGRSGATVNVAYKSGTNEFHGNVFWFLRNSATDARNYFASGPKPPFKRSQFGATIGGPLGRKNSKTFFFLSYEGQRSRQGLTFLNTVPTLAMHDGDFSELLAGPRPLTIYDPLTTRVNPAGGGTVRDAFPQNRIPAARFNSTSKKLMDLYPAPNLPGLASNYLLTPSDIRDLDQGSVKIDRDFTAGSRLFGRLTRAFSQTVNSRALGPVANPYSSVDIPVSQAVVSYTRIISPHMVNQSRVGVSREPIRTIELNGGQNLAEQYGIPNVNVDALTTGFPVINVGGMAGIGATGNIPAIIVSQNTQFSDNLDWTVGNHSLKVGFEVVFRQTNAYQANTGKGSFTFGTLYTANPATTANSGFGPADLLLGKPGSISLDGLVGLRGLRRSDWSMFVQDDWKITPRLTLNIGLRYEIPLGYPNTEVADRMLQFDVDTGLPAPVNQGKFPWRSGIPTDLNNWAPRFGLAYRLNNRTVIRSAYGIYYSLVPIPIGVTLVNNPPQGINTIVNNNQNDFVGARAITDGPLRTNDPNATGQNRTGIDPNFVVPYVQQWNLAVQRSLPLEQQLTVAYVGSKATRLPAGAAQIGAVSLNQPAPGDGAVNLRRRWPQNGNVDYYESFANSTYHSLQATLVKRFSNSMQYQFAYTYSHMIDGVDITGLPTYNLSGAKGNGDTDVRHQVRTTFGYELPFGRGKPLLNNVAPVVRQIVGGWEMNGVLTLYSGFPLSVTGTNTLNNGVATRADRLQDGNLPPDQRTVSRWFDLSAFANPGFRLWPNGGRNVIIGPGTKQIDFSLFKNVRLGEGQKQIQFRVEMFNATNTPQLNQPIGTIGATNSGTITSAGSPATLQRTERQIQFAVKFAF